MIPALVLAAGLGTRLDPLTRVVAKPAVPLGDRTLVEWTLAWLEGQGIRDVVLNLHHRPATITRVIGDGAHLGLSVRYSWEHPLLGSAGGPRHALPLLASDLFVIANGDTLCEVDLGPMIAAHERSGADVTMAVVPHPAPAAYNGVDVDAANVVRGFVPRGADGNRWHFVGVQVARRTVFAGLPDNLPAETVAGLYRDRMASAPGSIRAWQIETPAIDVGTPRGYLDADLAFRHGRPEHSPGLDAHRECVIWPGAVVADNADIRRCIVMSDVRVPRGFRARDAILAPPGILQPGDRAMTVEGIAIFALSAG